MARTRRSGATDGTDGENNSQDGVDSLVRGQSMTLSAQSLTAGHAKYNLGTPTLHEAPNSYDKAKHSAIYTHVAKAPNAQAPSPRMLPPCTQPRTKRRGWSTSGAG